MVLNFNCPSCGAPMGYDIAMGKLSCKHCGHSEDISDKWDENAASSFNCPNCGSVLGEDGRQASTVCPYCDTPVVLADRISGNMRPASILPFKLDRNSMEKSFKTWAGDGKFTPRGFVSKETLRDIKPVYVPFWLYDMETHVSLDATATKVRIYVRGETEFTETSFYNVHREMELQYSNVPYDASEKMDDAPMAKILPYNFSELKDFKLPYLAGFDADQRDFESKELFPMVRHQVEGYAADFASHTVTGYNGIVTKRRDINFKDIISRYVYLPIWFISYPYMGENYLFVMNGQTGKVVGEPPVSKFKVAAWFLGISAAIFAGLMLLGGIL